MVFSSITFVYAFFPLVAVAYYLSKNRVYRMSFCCSPRSCFIPGASRASCC